ncbi:hypothetical protein EVAR_88306_1 [Eumeta japonica]|uniref:Uncharacterized protein n=1 Tax=Eumeta variegata TaxID=151549 RepID=A0A4C1VPW3_EUMVA|nr:hypothetical protein EVAR_88306_1 [Eumeta japonica]
MNFFRYLGLIHPENELSPRNAHTVSGAGRGSKPIVTCAYYTCRRSAVQFRRHESRGKRPGLGRGLGAEAARVTADVSARTPPPAARRPPPPHAARRTPHECKRNASRSSLVVVIVSP